jgi:hypothetical protein
MAKRPLPVGQFPDDVSTGRPDKLSRIPEDMPPRLKEIVIKKQQLLEQIWKDQRNLIQYERSYLTACSYGNVLRGVIDCCFLADPFTCALQGISAVSYLYLCFLHSAVLYWCLLSRIYSDPG